MNRDIASTSGLSHDPLNYLQRSITKSRHLSPLAKRHVVITIRKVKAEGPYPLEVAVTRALWVRAYAELVRVQEKLDTLDVLDPKYKPAVWNLGKLSEVVAKFRTPKGTTPQRPGGKTQAGASALWQGKPAPPVPTERSVTNGEAA